MMLSVMSPTSILTSGPVQQTAFCSPQSVFRAHLQTIEQSTRSTKLRVCDSLLSHCALEIQFKRSDLSKEAKERKSEGTVTSPGHVALHLDLNHAIPIFGTYSYEKRTCSPIPIFEGRDVMCLPPPGPCRRLVRAVYYNIPFPWAAINAISGQARSRRVSLGLFECRGRPLLARLGSGPCGWREPRQP